MRKNDSGMKGHFKYASVRLKDKPRQYQHGVRSGKGTTETVATWCQKW